MRASEVQEIPNVCEACVEEIQSEIIIGVEVRMFDEFPVCLCKNCGVIDLDIMQFCRELSIGCNNN
jgi:uncharacterized Zn finger protein